MFIESLTLRGIKSYREEITIPFREGINFIAGRNGAGKTTIIESIGYLLFWIRPYQYKDLLSTGQKEGFLSVTFRGNDERTYTIAREIRKDKCKYVQLTDLQTGQIIEGEDVVRERVFKIHNIFSLDHLEEMFQEIVAVTQGKFTAPFLENGMEKKRKFQRMFGLETYEEAYKLSSQLPGILRDEIIDMEKNIIRLDEQLSVKSEEEEKEKTLKSALEELQKHFKEMEKGLSEKEEKVRTQKGIKEKLAEYEKDLLELRHQYKSAKEKEVDISMQVKKSAEAKTICEKYLHEHKKYMEVEEKLEKLSDQIRRSETIEKSFQDLIQQETKVVTEKEGYEKRLMTLEKSLEIPENKEVIDLKKAKEISEKLHEEKNKISQEKAVLTSLSDLKISLEKYLINLIQQEVTFQKIKEERTSLEKTLTAFDTLEARKKILFADEERFRELEKQLQEEKTSFAIQQAELQKMQTEQALCKDGECPTCGTKGDFSIHFSAKVQGKENSITQGKISLEKLQKELKTYEDLEERKKTLLKNEEEKRFITEQLEKINKTNYPADNSLIEETLRKIEEIVSEDFSLPKEVSSVSLKRVCEKVEIFMLQKKNVLEENEGRVEQERQANTSLIATLEAAKAETEKQIQEKEDISLLIKVLTEKHRNLEEKKKVLQTELTKFSEDKKAYTEFSEELKKLKTAHQEYIIYSKEAARLPDLEEALKAQQNAANSSLELGKKAKEAFDLLQNTFDLQAFEKLQDELSGQKALFAKSDTEKKRAEQDLAETRKKLELLVQKENERRDSLIEKQKKEKKLRKFEFVRSVLNQAAEPIATRFRTLLSDKAALFFRRLTQESSMLSWGEDFEVFLIKQEDHIRKFQQLSGGEQMICALSIRLALMRYVSPFRIGFFDEPTQNLDEAHRRSLASLLPHVLDGFEQLFLISHDDTFDALTEHVIVLEKTEDGTKLIGV